MFPAFIILRPTTQDSNRFSISLLFRTRTFLRKLYCYTVEGSTWGTATDQPFNLRKLFLAPHPTRLRLTVGYPA